MFRLNINKEGTMKKVFVFLSLLLLATWAYPADFKIMAGLSLSKSTERIGPDDGVWLYPPHPEFGAGFAAGGGIEFSLTRNLAIEADALFFQKGSRIRYEMSAIAPGVARISELSIPVLVKVFFKPGTSPYILGGGEFAFVLTDGPKSVDYGLIGGIGFRKQLNNIGLSLEARYHHGLQDMRPDNLIFSVFPTGLRKMRVFVFMLIFSI
jgi:hypothetical protein